MPKEFLINRHRIKRDNYRNATTYYDGKCENFAEIPSFQDEQISSVCRFEQVVLVFVEFHVGCDFLKTIKVSSGLISLITTLVKI